MESSKQDMVVGESVVVLSIEETVNKSMWQKGHFTSVCVLFSVVWAFDAIGY